MKLFSSESVLEILHQLLTSKSISSEKLSFKKNEETYTSNQYYLFTAFDFLIKYQILHKDRFKNEEFIRTFKELITSSLSYKDFFVKGNYLLIHSIKQKLGLSDIDKIDNKKKILEYAYQNYIGEGFYFYSFPSSLKQKVQRQGLIMDFSNPLIEEIKQVDEIFEKYHVKNVFGLPVKKIVEKNYHEITDSPSMAIYGAFTTLDYFSYFVSGPNFREFGDMEAYYRKDYDACSKNIENLCNKLEFTSKEKKVVMDYFRKQWDNLDATNLIPSIMFIERKAIGKDTLPDYDKILKQAEKKEDIIVSFSKIMDSRFPKYAHYTKIFPKDFKLYEFLTYQEILNNEKKGIKLEKVEQVQKEEKGLENLKQNNHGYADVIALFGFLSITLGLSWTIIQFCLGIH